MLLFGKDKCKLIEREIVRFEMIIDELTTKDEYKPNNVHVNKPFSLFFTRNVES